MDAMINFVANTPFGITFLVAGMGIVVLVACVALYAVYYERTKSLAEKLSTLGQLQNEVQRLKEEKESLRKTIDDYAEELLKLKPEREEQESLRAELARKETQIAEIEAVLPQKLQELKAVEEVKEKIDREIQEAEGLTRQIELLKKEKAEAEVALQAEQKKLEEVRQQEADARENVKKGLEGAAKAEALAAEFAVKQNLKAALDAEIQAAQTQLTNLRAEVRSIEAKEKEYDELVKKIVEQEMRLNAFSADTSFREVRKDQLDKEIAALEARAEAWRATVADIGEKKRAYEQLEAECSSLEREVLALGNEKQSLENELRGRKRDGKEKLGLKPLLELPPCLSLSLAAAPSHTRGERELLEDFSHYLERNKWHFHPRVLRSFHTSLKVSDYTCLTVLAGVSGTGKTALPKKYADFMGIHSLIVSVQPKWDSLQDLIGFFNYIDGSFKPTELAQAMVRLDPYNFGNVDNSYHDSLLLVLLDEMNLARVEYYFSEFLSKLELRRLGDEAVPERRAPAEISLECGSLEDGSLNKRIWPSRSILFVGTMNEDESTQTLSDKVLDRANVLRFGKPASLDGEVKSEFGEDATGDRRKLTAQLWKSWCEENHLSKQQRGEIRQWLDTLNVALDKIGRPIGYRVKEAIEAYVDSYPWEEGGSGYKLAFADQLEQKILPRFRGFEITDGQFNEAAETIRKVIAQVEDQELENAFDAAMANPVNGMFFWKGVTR